MNWYETIKTTKNYFAEVLENAFNTRNAKKRELLSLQKNGEKEWKECTFPKQ
jgi:hypothetical protein